MQLTTEPAMRGRVMAIRLAVALGGTPLGAPVVGWVANQFGPRWALGLGAASGAVAAAVGAVYMLRRRADALPGDLDRHERAAGACAGAADRD
jgi:MFS family permease